MMSAIRSRGNAATELRRIAIFRAHRITGWRRHQPVFGKPDFVFPTRKLASDNLSLAPPSSVHEGRKSIGPKKNFSE